MYYETVFVVNPDVSQENVHEFVDQLVEKVEKASGRIVKREYWGSLPLAYPINKRKRGHYTLLVTDGEPDAAAVLERALTLDERTMRYQTIRLSELTDTPSPLARRERANEDEAVEEAKVEGAEPAAVEKAVAAESEPKTEPAVEAVAETKEPVESEVVTEEVVEPKDTAEASKA
ncbi:MAG: 30S ribosomal protein S6 [Mariprofundaceae bacterium]